MRGAALAPELSVVAPLHNEAAAVRPLFAAICAALEPLGRPFEVLLVDGGSTDETPELLDALAAVDPRLVPVHLDGNFGEAAALCAGFAHARGGIILTLDGDLQNDPADLPRLLALLESGDYRAVSGWRRQRQEQYLWRVLPSRVANALIAAVTGVPSRDNGCGLKAYRAEVVKGVYLPNGLHRFMPAIFGVRAHQFAQLEVADRRRQGGRSHYGMGRLFAVLRDLLAVPHLLRGPYQALQELSVVAPAALLVGLVGLLFLQSRPWLALLWVAAAVVVSAYAQCVRASLRRWLRAQQEKTFRVRGAPSTAPRRPARSRAEVGG